MSPSLPLLKGTVSLEEALSSENDILQELSVPPKRLDFFCHLAEHRPVLEQLVSFHLGVPRERCKTASYDEWIHGSFNAVIPIYISEPASGGVKKVFIRLPLPYKIGESIRAGNSEEKVRCEAATYLWMGTNCPDIPIPGLRGFGFGFANGWSFTAPGNAPLLSRIAWALRRTALRLCGFPTPTQYVRGRSPCSFGTPYLIIDDVGRGKMLSETWDDSRDDSSRRANLFAGMSRIMLSLARTPFPAIGSLTINDSGVISLVNRPLTLTLQQLENSAIPTDIPRTLTYSSSDEYYSDLLTCQDNRLRHMPNSINSVEDGQHQLAAATLMRVALRQVTDPELRHGPFALMLTDLHQSNIFVDEDWNVTCIIDLEWVCALPREMQRAPVWLTSQGIDSLVYSGLEAYAPVQREFVSVFEQTELAMKGDTPDTQLIRQSWDHGSNWYFAALNCLNGLQILYMQHIQDLFAPFLETGDDFDRKVSRYWSTDSE